MSRLMPVSLLFIASMAMVLPACSGSEQRLVRFMESGERYFGEQNYDKARVEFSNALQIDPNNARARYFSGRIAESQSRLRDALGNYQAAIDLDPGYVPARAALGRIYLLGGLPDKARETIDPGLEIAPDDAGLRVVRGGLRAQQGDTQGALEDGEAAIKAAPDNELAIAFLAAQYKGRGRQDDAIRLLEDGIAKLPDSVDLRVILADLLLGAGNAGDAEKHLRAIAQSRSTELTSWQQLARFYVLQKRPGDAEAALRSAVDAMPASIEAKNTLVAFIAGQGDSGRARDQMLEFVRAEPKNGELRLSLGQFYEAARDPESAEAEYRSVIKSDGTKARGIEARDRLAALLVRRNDIAGAEKLVAEVLAENPRDNDALVLRAGIALQRNETSAAITDLRTVLRDQPNSPALMRTLARAHLQDKDTALAEEVLRLAVQANPADGQSRLELAELLVRTDRPNLALPVLEQLAHDQPDNLAVRSALAQVKAQQGDIKGALAAAEEIRKLRPIDPAGYFLAGTFHEQAGDLAQAATEYDRAARVAEDPVQATAALVALELKQKKPRQALERLEVQIERNPGNAQVWSLMGEVRLGQLDYDGAGQAFSKAIALQPSWWVPYRGLSRAQLVNRQTEQALATLTEGVAKAGESLELVSDLAALQLASNRHDDAVSTYENLLKRNPGNLVATNNLAMLLVTHREDKASLDRAAELADKLSTASEAPFLDTRGWVKYRRGDFIEAVALLKQAAEKAPTAQVIQYHLGMAQYRSGDVAGARATLAAVLATGASFNGVDEARATLEKLRDAG